MAAMVVLTTASLAAEAASAAATQRPSRITIAILPHGTSPAELAEVDGMAIGLLSAGIGSVPPAQTWIDIGQGARLNESLYDEALPRLYVDPGVGGAPPHVPPSVWQRVRDRAAGGPGRPRPGSPGGDLEARERVVRRPSRRWSRPPRSSWAPRARSSRGVNAGSAPALASPS